MRVSKLLVVSVITDWEFPPRAIIIQHLVFVRWESNRTEAVIQINVLGAGRNTQGILSSRTEMLTILEFLLIIIYPGYSKVSHNS